MLLSRPKFALWKSSGTALGKRLNYPWHPQRHPTPTRSQTRSQTAEGGGVEVGGSFQPVLSCAPEAVFVKMVMGLEGLGLWICLALSVLPFRVTLSVAAGNSPSCTPNPTPYLEGAFRLLQRAFSSLGDTRPQAYTAFHFGTFLSPWLKDSVFSRVECFLSPPQAIMTVPLQTTSLAHCFQI